MMRARFVMARCAGRYHEPSWESTPPIEVANLGMWDSLILMVMALVVFGPRRLPEIGRQIGKLMYEVRKASNDFKFQMEEELRKAEDADRRKKEEERRSALGAGGSGRWTLRLLNPGTPVESSLSRRRCLSACDRSRPKPQQEEPYPRIQPPSTGEPVSGGLQRRQLHPSRKPRRAAQRNREASADRGQREAAPAAEQARHG